MANSHFPPGGVTIASVYREYIANDTWSKPADLKELLVICFGAGGGGGGGASRINFSRFAGYGGGGGAVAVRRIPASLLGPTESITIGVGGTGGAGRTGAAGEGSGVNGTTGGATSFGSLVRAPGGYGGSRGRSDNGTVAHSFTGITALPFEFGAWHVRGSYRVDSNSPRFGVHAFDTREACAMGGTGRVISNLNVQSTINGDGGGAYNLGVLTTGGARATVIGQSGADGVSDIVRNMLDGYIQTYGPGTAGGGGECGSTADATVAAGNGGNGGRCSGGGGGGASTTGANAGNGGNAGNGYLLLMEIYD